MDFFSQLQEVREIYRMKYILFHKIRKREELVNLYYMYFLAFR